MINLENKSVVITGGTKGIGIEISKSFLKLNAKVFVLARHRPKKIIQSKGNKAIFIECDIRNIESLDQAVQKIKEASKTIDVLINNAGGAPMVNAIKASNKFHDAIIDLNLSAPLNVSQRFAKIMMKVLETNSGVLNSEIFNCGSNSNNHTKRDIVNIIKSKIKNTNINFKSGDTDPRNYRVDFSKLKNFFLFTPNISVEEGVQEIIDNFRLFSGKEKKFFGNYEIK